MNDDTLNTTRFGIEVEAFISSPVGRYLVALADQDAAKALDKLAEADPDDAKTIRDLQNTIARSRSIADWLRTAINNGHAALQALEAQERAD